MTAEGFRGSYVERVLDELTAQMGIDNRLGALEGARTGSPPRITWEPVNPGGISEEPCPFGLPGVTVIARQVLGFTVEIWADGYGEVTEAHKLLSAKLDVIAGPKQGFPADDVASSRAGYEIGKPSSFGPAQDDEGHTGSWAVRVPVSLKDFVIREVRPNATGHPSLAVVPDSPAGLTVLPTEVAWAAP